jgi:hypothetical protein
MRSDFRQKSALTLDTLGKLKPHKSLNGIEPVEPRK